MAFILFVITFPLAALLIPIYIMEYNVGLLNTTMGLVFPNVMNVLPFSIFIMRGIFLGLPIELEEAARMDGCSAVSYTHLILDPAILRPGRFDRKVAVGRPDVKGREEILKVHSKEKPLSEDVDLHRVAQTTSGFTGADLENLMNEAAIISARDNRRFIKQSDIDRAFVKVGIGAEKRSKVISEKDKKITAYHCLLYTSRCV